MGTKQLDHKSSDGNPAYSTKDTKTQPCQTPFSQTSRSSTELNENISVFDSSSLLESGNLSPEGCQKEAQVTTTPANAEEDSQITKASDDAEECNEKKEPIGEKHQSQTTGRLRDSSWWFLGALVMAVPLSILATLFPDENMDRIRVTGFLIWLEIIWTSGWISHLGIQCFGGLWYEFWTKHEMELWGWLFDQTATAQLAFILSLIAWISSPVMCRFTNYACVEIYWLKTFRKVLLATIPVSTLFLAKSILVEIIIIRQAKRLLRGKLEKRMRLWEVLFSILNSATADLPQKEALEGPQPEAKPLQKISEKISKAVFRDSPDEKDQFIEYITGKKRDEEFEQGPGNFKEKLRDFIRARSGIEFRGDMKDPQQLVYDWEKLRRMLQEAKNQRGGKILTIDEVNDVKEMVDQDSNQIISLKEWTDINLEVWESNRDANKSISGITKSVRGVNIVISGLLICIIAIIYAAFFTKKLSAYLTPIWTTITGLGFALGGTATEFLAACSFVFSKQPYDVGDRVVIDGKELIVDEICLLYTEFHRPSDGVVEHISHSKICGLWIANLSRSKNLRLTAQIFLPEFVKDASFTRLNEIEKDLRSYIKSNSPCSRYLKSNVSLSVEYSEDKSGKLLLEMRPREILNRREETLIQANKMVRDKLEDLLQGPKYRSSTG